MQAKTWSLFQNILDGRMRERFAQNNPKKNPNPINIRVAENKSVHEIFRIYPLFATWPQVLKRIILVSNDRKALQETTTYLWLYILVKPVTGKRSSIRERNSRNFAETHKTMIEGRSYRNIYSILNKYPRRRMGYNTTSSMVIIYFYMGR